MNRSNPDCVFSVVLPVPFRATEVAGVLSPWALTEPYVNLPAHPAHATDEEECFTTTVGVSRASRLEEMTGRFLAYGKTATSIVQSTRAGAPATVDGIQDRRQMLLCTCRDL